MPPVRQPGRHVGIPRLQPWGGGQRLALAIRSPQRCSFRPQLCVVGDGSGAAGGAGHETVAR